MSTPPLTDTHCSPGGKVHSASQSAVKTILLGEAEDGEVMEAQRVAENEKGTLLSETETRDEKQAWSERGCLSGSS